MSYDHHEGKTKIGADQVQTIFYYAKMMFALELREILT